MVKFLLHLGLIATPFFFLPGHDMRDLKMAAAVLFAIVISAVGIYFHGLRKFPNKWLIILLCYLPISVFLAPAPTIKLVGLDVSYFWSWEPFLQIVLFSLLAITVSGYSFKYMEIDTVLTTMVYCGSFMAFYMVMQFFFMDQFFKPLDSFIPGRGHVSGFIGNPTLVAPFVAMLVPISVYLKKYIYAFFMAVAVIMTDSQVGYISMFLTMVIYMGLKNIKYAIGATAIIVMGIAGVVYDLNSNSPRLNDNQRFFMWKQIVKDIKSPIAEGTDAAYPLTGRGIGSFKYVFHQEHPGTEEKPNRFMQAHNDFLEFAYGAGILGLAILLMAIWSAFMFCFEGFSFKFGDMHTRRRALMASFACVCLCSLGTFAFQIGTISFYTSVLVGLMHNEMA